MQWKLLSFLRGSRVHDAGRDRTAARSFVIVIHSQIVTKLMSNDGGEGGNIIIGELRRDRETEKDTERENPVLRCLVKNYTLILT